MNCKLCKKSFYLKPSAIKRGRGKFCSKVCVYNYRSKRVRKECAICGLEFYVKRSRDKTTNVRTCSRECAAKNISGSNNHNYKDGRSRDRLIKKGVASGKKHWNWQGGKTDKSAAIRSSSKYKKWRKSVFERDDYICQFCKQRGGTLNADHIKPLLLYPELVFDIDNGRTLCIECHKTTDTYGFKLYHLNRKKYDNTNI